LEPPSLGTQPLRAAFRPDGQELTALVDAGPDKMLVRWNLATGNKTEEFPVPPAAVGYYLPFHHGLNGMRQGLEYRGPGYLMLDDHFLIDLARKAVVWRYHLPLGMYAANSPDHMTWYCIRRQAAGDNSLFLASRETPSPEVKNKTAGVALDQQLVLSPGQNIKLHIDLNGVGMSDLAPTVEKSLLQALELRKLAIDSAAPLQFSFVAAERTTGEQIGIYNDSSPFRSSFFRPSGQPDQVVSQQEMVVRMSVSNSAGKVLWHLDRTQRMRSYGSVKSEDAGQELREEMTKGFQNMLASSGSATESLPRYIFADLGTVLAGESALAFQSESPPPAVAAPQNQAPKAELTIHP
jgi:hypothetical protein